MALKEDGVGLQTTAWSAPEQGALFVVTGPSGTGKTTLVQQALSDIPGLQFSVSATTRPQRKGEENGRNYHFLDRAAFTAKVEADEDDIEIFEDQDGIEIKMKIHGALEVEGNEYAIMSYVDNINSEFEIMMINRGRGNKVSYSNVEDDELYEQLSEAAVQHLESTSAI